MSTLSSSRSEFWTEHFVKLAKRESARNEQLDFSNHALVVQNYAYMLEACGAIAGKSLLDAGFGTGDLARTFNVLGATVTAIDVVKNRIPHLRELAPGIAWWQGDLGEWTLPRTADKFDIVSACESLQYVEFDDAVDRLLNAVNEEGRLVILIPNADCPIVQRTSERFSHQYVGVSMKSLPSRLQRLTNENYIAYRGIHFQDDQTLVPYISGPWFRVIAPDQHATDRKDAVETNASTNAIHSAENIPGPHIVDRSNVDDTKPANRVQIVISRSNAK